MDDIQINYPYEIWNIEVGIVNVVNVRVIAKIDNEPSVIDNIITNFLSEVNHKDFNSKVIVETFNEDYDYTLTIFRDDEKKVYLTELEKRMGRGVKKEIKL